MFDGLGKDGLTGDLCRIGMYEIGTAPANHDTVRMGIRLDGRDSLGEPVQGEACVNNTDYLTITVFDRLTVTGNHLAGIGLHIIVHIRFRPARVVKKYRHKIPVSEEILVRVIATLYGTNRVTIALGIGREVTSPVLEIVRFKGNGAVVEIRVVQ